jgi:hypothetical protein
MSATLLVPLTLVVAIAGCGSDSSSSAQPAVADVAIVGCRGSLHVEPSEVVACAADDGVNIDHVKWTGWGEDPAYGRGRAVSNSCEPYCAAGNYHIFRIVLIATGLKPCQGKQVYSTIRFAVIEEAPSAPPGPGWLAPAPGRYCD